MYIYYVFMHMFCTHYARMHTLRYNIMQVLYVSHIKLC